MAQIYHRQKEIGSNFFEIGSTVHQPNGHLRREEEGRESAWLCLWTYLKSSDPIYFCRWYTKLTKIARVPHGVLGQTCGKNRRIKCHPFWPPDFSLAFCHRCHPCCLISNCWGSTPALYKQNFWLSDFGSLFSVFYRAFARKWEKLGRIFCAQKVLHIWFSLIST